MPEKQDGHPNLNKGGNDGNQFGAGAPRKAFRNKAARAAEKELDYWISVARGNKVIVVPGFGNQKDTTRRPNHRERKEAYVEVLLRFGIGTQDEVLMLQNSDVIEAFGSVLPQFVTPEQLDTIFDRVKDILGGSS